MVPLINHTCAAPAMTSETVSPQIHTLAEKNTAVCVCVPIQDTVAAPSRSSVLPSAREGTTKIITQCPRSLLGPCP